MKNFYSTIDELKAIISQCGIDGTWSLTKMDVQQFKSNDGAILDWWWHAKKKTVRFQGDIEARTRLETALDKCMGNSDNSHNSVNNSFLNSGQNYKQKNKQIFIVHGHDETAREQLELILRRLDLEPFILMNSSSGGMTIIEALEKQIGKESKTSFGIVLLTPDDMGYAGSEGESETKPRARQNVILEMGMLMSSLTRSKIAILEKGYVEIPSDAEGILRIKFQQHVKETVPRLVQHLAIAGFQISSEKIAQASS